MFTCYLIHAHPLLVVDAGRYELPASGPAPAIVVRHRPGARTGPIEATAAQAAQP